MKRTYLDIVTTAGVVLLAGALSVEPAFSQVPNRTKVDELIDAGNSAKADVKKTTPSSGSRKAVEDLLDEAERNVDTANKNLETEKSIPNNGKGIKKAEANVKAAKDARDPLKEVAKKNGSPPYGDALKKLRDARKALEKAYKQLRGSSDKESRALKKKLRQAIRDLKPKEKGLSFLQMTSRGLARNIADNARRSAVVLSRGSEHHP